jgi:hypothetical protein
MEHFFSTFCHISDYDAKGFSMIEQMIETSYPLVLWAPPGARMHEYYRIGVCPTSPEKLINYVENGYVHIVGREKWLLDEHYRQHYAEAHAFAKWHDNFDGALKSIWRDQQSMPEEQRSVRIAPDADGWEWANKLIQEQPGRIDPIWNRIIKKQVPLVSLKRIQPYEGDKEKSVLQVLSDARNHTKAIHDTKVDMPFLLHRNEGSFFRFLERYQTEKTTLKSLTSHRGIKLQFIQEAHRLVERFKHPEKVSSLDAFIGSEAHKDLARWLHSTADLAQLYWSKQALRAFLLKQLQHDIRYGKEAYSKHATGMPRIEMITNISSLITSIASLYFTGLTFDPNTAFSISSLIMDVVPIVSGISQRLGIVKADYNGPQWPYLVRFNRTPTKRDIEEVKAILDTLIAVLDEDK